MGKQVVDIMCICHLSNLPKVSLCPLGPQQVAPGEPDIFPRIFGSPGAGCPGAGSPGALLLWSEVGETLSQPPVSPWGWQTKCLSIPHSSTAR